MAFVNGGLDLPQKVGEATPRPAVTGGEWFAELACQQCGAVVSEPRAAYNNCARCQGAVRLSFRLARQSPADGRRWLERMGLGVWTYGDLLPRPDDANRLTLGEGNTPLLASRFFRRVYNRRVFWKNEAANPTWSHKDRFHAVAASMARQDGFRVMVGTSTGNHGISAAAYAAQGELRSMLLYPPETPSTFLHLTGLYGGLAVVTEWDNRRRVLNSLLEQHPWCPVDRRNPYGGEGYKTIAFELVRDLGSAPDVVAVPVASGRLILGIAKGFDELLQLGWVDKVPRFLACQGAGADVLSGPMNEGRQETDTKQDAYSVALSTRERTSDPRILRVLHETNGKVVSVPDGAIMAAVRRLGEEGIAAEPASALAAACVKQLGDQDELAANETVVVVLTSSLTKSPDLISEVSHSKPTRISGDASELDELLSREGLSSE